MNHSFHKVSMNQFRLHGILEKFKSFSPELGLVKEVKVHLICKKDVIPKISTAHLDHIHL